MSANRYLSAARHIALAIPEILIGEGLEPLVNRYVLAESAQGNTWLFVVMNDSLIEIPESYASARVLSHLSAALNGHPVRFSNTNGLRYAVLLSRFKNLAGKIPDREHSLLD